MSSFTNLCTRTFYRSIWITAKHPTMDGFIFVILYNTVKKLFLLLISPYFFIKPFFIAVRKKIKLS